MNLSIVSLDDIVYYEENRQQWAELLQCTVSYLSDIFYKD